MGRSDWQRMADDDFVAVAAPKRSRAWPMLGGLLLVGSVGFVVSYYLPLFRAHQTLNKEYVRLAGHSREQGEKLEQTVAALRRTASERDELKAKREKEALELAAGRQSLASLEKELRVELADALTKKLVVVSGSDQAVEIALQSASLFRRDAAAPTPQGQELLCRIAKVLSAHQAKASVLGSATLADTQQRALKAFPSAWHLGAARGASAAEALTEKCGTSGERVVASGLSLSDKASAPVLTVKLHL
jgi:flagellar motor protein MotB